jgi:ATP-dependent helicase HrpB
MIPAGPEETRAALAKALAGRLELLDWNEAAQNLIARVGLMRGIDPAFPDFSRTALAAGAEEWLAPYLAGMSNIKEAKALDVAGILRGMLGHEQVRRLDRELPGFLELPGGRVAVDYTGPTPKIEARAKVFYGLDETPKLAGGRVGLQMALLSPAGRPIAITADLAGFWRNGWKDARRDMRGRYPKHDWPEEPWVK